nr:probable protein phosphatase 2C 65 [Ipomoea batatas]
MDVVVSASKQIPAKTETRPRRFMAIAGQDKTFIKKGLHETKNGCLLYLPEGEKARWKSRVKMQKTGEREAEERKHDCIVRKEEIAGARMQGALDLPDLFFHGEHLIIGIWEIPRAIMCTEERYQINLFQNQLTRRLEALIFRVKSERLRAVKEEVMATAEEPNCISRRDARSRFVLASPWPRAFETSA